MRCLISNLWQTTLTAKQRSNQDEGLSLRKEILTVAFLAGLTPVPAIAGDKVLTGPTPDWAIPAPPVKPGQLSTSANVMALFDEQVLVDGDTVNAYFDSARIISNADILAKSGTFAMNWQPNRGDLTIHRLEILRGGTVIDALGHGEGFTVLRREAGLENMIVTGQLTAVKHIEGLQIGDMLRVSFSLSNRDVTLAGNVQDRLILLPAPTQIQFGRARLVWRSEHPLAWKPMMSGLSLVPNTIPGGWSELVVPLPAPKLPDTPKNMPLRFEPAPILEFSSFESWGKVAQVMAPYYSAKGAIAEGTDLAAKVDAIAARSADPIQRMADALQLVQNDVRYQLLALGQGNYMPQPVSETWQKRFGDCKAKTLLLLAILDRLKINAAPVLANIKRGDTVAQLLPSVMAFDHVFVRAQVNGEDFWLDGTMLGSRAADIRNIPRYGFVLPLAPSSAELIDLPRRADARPNIDISVAIDMSAGPHLPAPFRMTLRYAGPFAETTKLQPGGDYEDRLATFAENAGKNWGGSATIGRPTSSYDPDAAVWTVNVEGASYPDWQFEDGRYRLALPPTLKVDFDAPRDRASWRTIPAIINAPWNAHSHVSIKLPDNVRSVTGGNGAIVLPAVGWKRTVTRNGDNMLEEDITSLETGAEVPAKDISTTAKIIGEAISKTAHIELEGSYPQRWQDIPRVRASAAVTKLKVLFDQRVVDRPDDATRISDRAWLNERLLDRVGAEADYSKAIALDPTAARFLARANLRSERIDHPGALKDAHAAYELEEGNNDVRDKLALELAQAGKVDEGLALLPEDPDTSTEKGLTDFLHRIDVLEIGNRHAEAVALLDHALESRNIADLHNARCWYSALRDQDLDQALADCDRALELSSGAAAYLDSRALVHYRAGRLPQAKLDYEAALGKFPDLASALFMRGIVLNQLGNKSEGETSIKAARAIYPDIEHFFGNFTIRP